MILSKHFRVMASASLLALAIAGLSTGFVHAGANGLSKAACEQLHLRWDPVKGCADLACNDNGRFYLDGEFIITGPGRGTVKMCDGFTGNWVTLRTTDPQGPLNPRAPRPTTNGR